MEWLMLCVCDFYSNVKQHWILHGEKTMMNWSCCWQTSRYEQKAVFTVFPEKTVIVISRFITETVFLTTVSEFF